MDDSAVLRVRGRINGRKGYELVRLPVGEVRELLAELDRRGRWACEAELRACAAERELAGESR